MVSDSTSAPPGTGVPSGTRFEWTLWLVVAAIGAHVTEEYALGFTGWAHTLGVPLTSEDFHLANACVTLYAVGCAAVGWRAPWLALSSAALVALNAVLVHLGASLLTASYSPGTTTAIVLFVPAAAAAYAGARRDRVLTGATVAVSMGLGLGWHALLGGVFYVKYFAPLYR